jgi:hypothetical protein
MTEQDSIFTIKDVSATGFVVHLAWDEEKSGYLPRTGSTEQDSYMAFGFLWSKYSAEIIEHIQGKPRNATPLEAIEDHLRRIENAIRYLGERGGESILDQVALVQMIARLDRQIRRLNTEVFSTRITQQLDKHSNTERTRQTLLGRVDSLSNMAALGTVDQSFFLED